MVPAPPPSSPDEVALLRAEVDGLRTAMQSREVIDQAKGILVARFHCSPQAAFAVLVRWSQQRQVKVRTLSELVVRLVQQEPPASVAAEDLAAWLSEQLEAPCPDLPRRPAAASCARPARTTGPDDVPARVTALLGRLAHDVQQGEAADPRDLLRRLARSIPMAIPGAQAGVMHVEHGSLRFLGATTDDVGEVERLQETLRLGPCGDALLSAKPVVAPDLTTADGRWPGYTERAVQLGLRSVAALPLTARGTVQAVLDLYRPAPGGFTPQEVRAGRVLADVAASYLVLAAERDAARAAQAHTTLRALHDDLTGLPQRVLLLDRLRQSLAMARRHATAVAVVCLGLDGVQLVDGGPERRDDQFGLLVADSIVREVARRLAGSLRGEDTLARPEADLLALVLSGLPDRVGSPHGTAPADGVPAPRGWEEPRAGKYHDEGPVADSVAAVVGRLRRVLAEPVRVGGLELTVRMRLGLAVGPVPGVPHDDQAEHQLRAAESAMHLDRPAPDGW